MIEATPSRARSSSRIGSLARSGAGPSSWASCSSGRSSAVALDEDVRLVQERQVVRVALSDVDAEIGRQPQHAVAEADRAAEQQHPAVREVAEVDGLAAVRAADHDRDVLGAARRRLHVPLAEHAEPPAEVALAIPPRRPVVRARPTGTPSVQRAAARRRSASRTIPHRPPARRRPAAAAGSCSRSSGAAARRYRPAPEQGTLAPGTARSRRPRNWPRRCLPRSRRGTRAGPRYAART